MRPIVVVAVVCALSGVRRLPAQQPRLGGTAAVAASAAAPSATAVRATAAPVIDGRDDDPVWRDAPATGEFLEFQPAEGKAPRFRTEFRVAYDDRNLYVFVRAFDPHPDSIMTALTRRDVRGPSDQLKVMLDSYHDRRSGFEFAVNPVGVKRDYAMYNDQDEDQSWDGVWDVGTRVDSLGWTAEFRIPFSQLRYANMREHVFGFAVWRDIERFKERTSWPLYRSTQGGVSSQLGLLQGIRDITPFHRLEVVPYGVAKSVSVPHSDAPWERSQKLSAGADVKYGLTPNLTLDATVNPDFGQVEADPAVLNLTAFETFFEEKRPFFIEGTGLYKFDVNCSIVTCNGEGLFYSRRIGREPQLYDRYAGDASPNVTPILGATKLTGRLARGLNVGALEAVTDRVTGASDRTTEPRTSYTVLRAQQDLRNGETSVGVIATGVVRALDSWSESYLRRDAFTAATNLRHRWGASRYEATASLAASDVRGTPEAILLTQTSPVHFYQRPDGGLPLDSARTVLGGDAEQVSFGKYGGNMVHFQTSYERQSPGFEVNDLGFLRRANQQRFNNWMGLSFRKPTRLYRQLSGNFNAWGYWTTAGLPTERAVNTNWHMNLANNMWVHAGSTISQLPGTYCDNCARGGPAFRRSPLASVNVGWAGDDRRHVVPSVFVFGARGDYGASRFVEVTPELQLIPMSQLQLDLTADWSVNHDDSQWLDNIVDAGGVTHYTFARLEQETRSLGVRVSYTATPGLSFQLYAAPFLSRGRYTAPRELSAAPRARRYEDRYTPYTPPPDTPLGFDALQLRSNSVLRWEFRPGSALFLVWSHGRDGYDPRFRGRPWRGEYDDLFALHPANTFLMKVAYWLD
ncbi:MAG TPA: DUF5916 domain-containing protein [Gemmatimonadaceae bacterium]|nr:DUF5916 domain-containing protein [Gemmatimonadaceae bacterium]